MLIILSNVQDTITIPDNEPQYDALGTINNLNDT